MYSPIAKRPRRPPGALLAASLLFAGAACGRAHTVSTAGGKVGCRETGKDAGTVTVTGKDGKTATLSFNRSKVPGDYPKDVPVYSPSKVVMSQSASEKNTRNPMLESAGATMTTAQLTILSAAKERRQVMLRISGSGSQRGIMQVVSDKP